MLGYAVKPFHPKGSFIDRFFGVHTLEEFRHFCTECNQNLLNETPTLAILGNMPSGVTLSMPFLDSVFAFDSENDPMVDVHSLRSIFGIGKNRVVFRHSTDVQKFQLFRLVLACSFEVEYFLPHSKFLASFRNFINLQLNSFHEQLKSGLFSAVIPRKYLHSHDSPEYRRFLEGVLLRSFFDIEFELLSPRCDLSHSADTRGQVA